MFCSSSREKQVKKNNDKRKAKGAVISIRRFIFLYKVESMSDDPFTRSTIVEPKNVIQQFLRELVAGVYV